jgi:hypothetical protein
MQQCGGSSGGAGVGRCQQGGGGLRHPLAHAWRVYIGVQQSGVLWDSEL